MTSKIIIILCCAPLYLFALAGHGFNDVDGIYQWDSGRHGSVAIQSTDKADGFPALTFMNGLATSFAQKFDTHHNPDSYKSGKKDFIAAVQVGFCDISESFHSYASFFNINPRQTFSTTIGTIVKIAIWDGTVGDSNQTLANALYTQDYQIQAQDLGIKSNFVQPCPPYNPKSAKSIKGKGHCRDSDSCPLSSGNLTSLKQGNGSNIRPLFFDPQGQGNHTRRERPYNIQDHFNGNPFSEYGTLFTTIVLDHEVEVSNEFYVGVIVESPEDPNSPNDDVNSVSIGMSVVNLAAKQGNGIHYQDLGLTNNTAIQVPNIHPIANGYRAIPEAFISPGSVSKHEDEFYSIRAIPKSYFKRWNS